MTIIFPDVSQYNGAFNFTGYSVAWARACISNVQDTEWTTNLANAGRLGVPLGAYAFLNAPSLGVSVTAQADFAFSVIGAGRTMMIDLEPNRNACASLADALNFAARFRANGGTTHLIYLPKWAWSSWMGSPSLTPLTTAGLHLVSSNYTTYSDTGPGWAAYGGVTPDQWQFTDNLNGTGADGNAYRGTVADYLTLINGTAADMADTVITWNTGWMLQGLLQGKDPIPIPPSPSIGAPGGSVPNAVAQSAAALNTKLDALAKVVAAVVSAEGIDLQQVLAALTVMPPTAVTVALSDAQVAAVGTAVAAAVVGGHDALNAADLAGVQAAAEAAVRAVLGGLG